MRLLSVVGARPQFVKLAPVDAATKRAGHQHVIVHTGQHYDRNMSEVFFEDLSIPSPDVNLNVGSGSHAAQTAAMLEGLEATILAHDPDWVVVYGDTNSTIAATLAAVKQHVRVAHVEAGLRSFNRRMPEEHNRVLTDHAADLLLAPTDVAMGHLADEGLGERSRLVGDVMLDVFETVRQKIGPDVLGERDEGLVLATIHRQENTDDADRLAAILDALTELPNQVLLAAHPRLRAAADRIGIPLDRGSVRTCEPLEYPQLVRVLTAAQAVVTDSGGLQKEAFFAGTPCTTVRSETEWVETLEGGWNVLAPEPDAIAGAVNRDRPTAERGAPYGTGDAGSRVVAAIEGGH